MGPGSRMGRREYPVSQTAKNPYLQTVLHLFMLCSKVMGKIRPSDDGSTKRGVDIDFFMFFILLLSFFQAMTAGPQDRRFCCLQRQWKADRAFQNATRILILQIV